MLYSQKHIYERNLYQLKSQIAATSRLLNSLRMSCVRERREIEHLHDEQIRIENVVTQFSNNEEYLRIKQEAEGKVKDVLTNGKLLLQFAAGSIIESLRINPELYNFLLNDITNNTDTTSYGSSYPSLMPEQQQHQQSFNDSYAALILEEAKIFTVS